MTRITIEVAVPERQLFSRKLPKRTFVRRVLERTVIELLREHRISQGRAADLLGIDRWAVLDLMGRERMTTGPESGAELRRELRTGRKLLAERRA